jgi:hypothetical protein
LLDTHFRTDDPLLAKGQTGWAHSRPAAPPRAGEDRGRVVPHPAHLPRWRARTPEDAPDMLPCHFAMRFSREEVISGLPMRLFHSVRFYPDSQLAFVSGGAYSAVDDRITSG